MDNTILNLKAVKEEVSRYAAHPNSESLQDILSVTCPLTPIERAEIVKELLKLSGHHGLSKAELNAEIKRLLKTAEDTPFFEGKALKPLRVVNALRESNVYLTTKVDKQLRIYEDGVYRKDDIRETARDVIQLLNDDVTRGGVDGVISLLQDLTMCDIPIHTDWLNFKNGRFCLDSWELLEHSPEYRSIVQMPVEFNPDAKCPEFDKFLPSVLSKEDDQFLLLQLMGYSMLQDLRFGKIVYLYGPTHTGKSTILKVLRALLGEENTAALTWHALDNEDRRFSRAGLVGKLANLSGDLSSKYLAGDSQIKQISVGDAIDVEFKGVQSFTVEQYCTLWASGNSLPVSHDRTDAWYERLVLIPFTQQHRGKDADKHLPNRLKQPEELSGILNRILEALRILLVNGVFTETESTKELLKQYQQENDHVNRFLSENYQRCAEESLENNVFAHYTKWCEDEGIKPLSKTKFRDGVHKWGCPRVRKKTNGDRYFVFSGMREM